MLLQKSQQNYYLLWVSSWSYFCQWWSLAPVIRTEAFPAMSSMHWNRFDRGQLFGWAAFVHTLMNQAPDFFHISRVSAHILHSQLGEPVAALSVDTLPISTPHFWQAAFLQSLQYKAVGPRKPKASPHSTHLFVPLPSAFFFMFSSRCTSFLSKKQNQELLKCATYPLEMLISW